MIIDVIDLSVLPDGDGFLVRGDNVYDEAGFSVSAAGDINGDGIDDFLVGARLADAGELRSGITYVIFGKAGATRPDIDLTTLAASDGFRIIGDLEVDLSGSAVAAAGDVNGDGIDDLIVGAPYNDRGGNYAGEAYVIFGKAGATRSDIDLSAMAATDGFRVTGDAEGDQAGRSVSGAGDINGDGIDDFIIGAPVGDDGGSGAGEAYVIYGRLGATRANIDLTNLTMSGGFKIVGSAVNDLLGNSVSAAGDVNGDGIDDLLVGAYSADDGLDANAGHAYVIFGQATATRSNINVGTLAPNEGFRIVGDARQDYAGRSVSSAGDVNGDGIDDIIVGASGYASGSTPAGEAYVIFGKAGATRANINLGALAASDGFALRGAGSGDMTGISVAGVGDVNGDGIDDLLVGAAFGDNGGIDAGQAYIVFGKSGATRADINLAALAFSDGAIIEGAAAGDRAGFSVAGAGDVNNDGFADLIVGAPNNGNGGVRAGEAYIIFGQPNFGPAPITGTAAGETLTGTAGIDIIDALGGNDILVGGGGEDRFNGGAGNDIVTVDSAGDVVTELAGEGTDHIDTSLASYTLPANVENLEYTGGTAFTGTGNGEANIIVGGAAGDTLSGLQGNDTLGGQAGNDLLTGGDGDDRLNGGAGSDTMNGGAGNDILMVDSTGDVANGGDGSDTVQIVAAGLTYTTAADIEIVSNQSGGALTVTLNALSNSFGGSTGIDQVFAGLGADILYGRDGNDILSGQDGNDRLFGEAGGDQLSGGSGDDLVYGGAENDTVSGDEGNDILYGEAGNDFLAGNDGVDQLFGGAGSDRFVFAGVSNSGTTLATADRIRDFSQAQGDRIDFSPIDATPGGSNDAFTFIGTAAFSGVAGQLRYQIVGGETRVSGDVDGDGLADFLIRVDGVHMLVAEDFFL